MKTPHVPVAPVPPAPAAVYAVDPEFVRDLAGWLDRRAARLFAVADRLREGPTRTDVIAEAAQLRGRANRLRAGVFTASETATAEGGVL